MLRFVEFRKFSTPVCAFNHDQKLATSVVINHHDGILLPSPCFLLKAKGEEEGRGGGGGG